METEGIIPKNPHRVWGVVLMFVTLALTIALCYTQTESDAPAMLYNAHALASFFTGGAFTLCTLYVLNQFLARTGTFSILIKILCSAMAFYVLHHYNSSATGRMSVTAVLLNALVFLGPFIFSALWHLVRYGTGHKTSVRRNAQASSSTIGNGQNRFANTISKDQSKQYEDEIAAQSLTYQIKIASDAGRYEAIISESKRDFELRLAEQTASYKNRLETRMKELEAQTEPQPGSQLSLDTPIAHQFETHQTDHEEWKAAIQHHAEQHAAELANLERKHQQLLADEIRNFEDTRAKQSLRFNESLSADLADFETLRHENKINRSKLMEADAAQFDVSRAEQQATLAAQLSALREKFEMQLRETSISYDKQLAIAAINFNAETDQQAADHKALLLQEQVQFENQRKELTEKQQALIEDMQNSFDTMKEEIHVKQQTELEESANTHQAKLKQLSAEHKARLQQASLELEAKLAQVQHQNSDALKTQAERFETQRLDQWNRSKLQMESEADSYEQQMIEGRRKFEQLLLEESTKHQLQLNEKVTRFDTMAKEAEQNYERRLSEIDKNYDGLLKQQEHQLQQHLKNQAEKLDGQNRDLAQRSAFAKRDNTSLPTGLHDDEERNRVLMRSQDDKYKSLIAAAESRHQLLLEAALKNQELETQISLSASEQQLKKKHEAQLIEQEHNYKNQLNDLINSLREKKRMLEEQWEQESLELRKQHQINLQLDINRFEQERKQRPLILDNDLPNDGVLRNQEEPTLTTYQEDSGVDKKSGVDAGLLPSPFNPSADDTSTIEKPSDIYRNPAKSPDRRVWNVSLSDTSPVMLLNAVTLYVQLAPKVGDREEMTYLYPAPLGIRLGDYFNHFLNVKLREMNDEIEVADSHGILYQWTFHKKATFSTKQLEPTLSLIKNKVEATTIIRAKRVFSLKQ
jgi:hypothetical protein